MENNWIVDNLENALTTWNEKLAEMWTLLTESPQTFKGGTIWSTVTTINGAMQAISYGMLVLFFAISIFKSYATFRDFQRPEYVFKHFIYFILAKLGITYGMDLMVNIFDVCNGIVATAASSVGGITSASAALPPEIITAIEDVGFLASIPLWLVTMLGSLFITVLAFIMILTVYGRFFKLYNVCRPVAGGAGFLCGRKHHPFRQSVPAELYRRVHGRRGHRAGLHHFFRLCVQRRHGR